MGKLSVFQALLASWIGILEEEEGTPVARLITLVSPSSELLVWPLRGTVTHRLLQEAHLETQANAWQSQATPCPRVGGVCLVTVGLCPA